MTLPGCKVDPIPSFLHRIVFVCFFFIFFRLFFWPSEGVWRHSDRVSPPKQPRRGRRQGDKGREQQVVRREVPGPYHERPRLLSRIHAGMIYRYRSSLFCKLLNTSVATPYTYRYDIEILLIVNFAPLTPSEPQNPSLY